MDPARCLTLKTGAFMPRVGLGTWQSSPNEVGEAVRYALLECGYRHIDCAWIYQNEKEIGTALKNIFNTGPIKREEVFVTSKLWNSFHAKERVAAVCKESLRNLNLDYLDLYLMHWGVAMSAEKLEPLDEKGVLVTERVPIRETWEAMQDLVKAGLVKAIGVSNFTAPMLVDLLSYAEIPPAINQVELHPYLQQASFVEFCRYKGIAVTGYSPLGRPGYPETKVRLLDEDTICRIARARGKTSAQVVLRWAVQRGTIAIPKSVHPERIRENIEVFDFELSREDMEGIAALDKGFRFCNPEEWWKIPYFG